MNVEAFLLCDAATKNNTKVNVLGCFDHITPKTLPYRHEICAVVARVRFFKSEEGKHPVKIEMIAPNGELMKPKITGNVNVTIPEDRDSQISNIVLFLQRLNFKEYGTYAVNLIIDKITKAFVPLNVKKKW